VFSFDNEIAELEALIGRFWPKNVRHSPCLQPGRTGTASTVPSIRRVLIPVLNEHTSAESAPRRVLFVNGDADLRAVVTRVLEREDYHVHAVPHSGHALLLCRLTQFDVVVTELSSPDVSGPVLAEQLRRHWPELTAVYLGNPGSPEGVNHLVVRPFTCDDLVDRIESALAGIAA